MTKIIRLDTNRIQFNAISYICESINNLGLDMKTMRIKISNFICKEISEFKFKGSEIHLGFINEEIVNTFMYMNAHLKIQIESHENNDSKCFYEITMDMQFSYTIENIPKEPELRKQKIDIHRKYAMDYIYTYIVYFVNSSGVDWVTGKINFPNKLTLDDSNFVYNIGSSTNPTLFGGEKPIYKYNHYINLKEEM